MIGLARRGALLFLVASVAVGLLGCGGDGRPKVVPVSGQVLLNGQPMAAGVPGDIYVTPEGGRPAHGTIDPQTGAFALSTFGENDGCVTGTHAVTVDVSVLKPNGEPFRLTPDKYSDPKSSGLTAKIDGPTKDLKIELTGELRKAPPGAGKVDPNL